jgi:hypothetical protein
MTIKTLVSFLVGRHSAILQVATCRSALLVAGIFVLSAGLAREFDHEDLLADPWYVLIPLVASLLTSFMLFLLLYSVSQRRSVEQLSFKNSYRSFLTAYWMTAPLAWLYAIPVEQLFNEENATRANLSLLAIVALWRVTLITRVVQVLFGARIWAALGLVMFFADSLALAVPYFTPLPIFNIMGGIRLSASERMIQETAMLVGCIGTLSWPVWLLSVVGIAGSSDRSWKPALLTDTTATQISRPLWGLAAASLAMWVIILPMTQPEQQLRRQTERMFAAGKLSEALELMSIHEPEDYPPHWSPPPHLGYRRPDPPLLDILEVTLSTPVAPWVSERFLNKLEARMDNRWLFFQEEPDELARMLSVLERLPNLKDIMGRHEEFLEQFELLENEDLKNRARTLRLMLDHSGNLQGSEAGSTSERPGQIE